MNLLDQTRAVGVAGDLLIDFECECESSAGRRACDTWLRSVAHCGEKVFELQA